MSADKENAVKGRGVTVKGLAVAYGEKRVFDGFDIAFPAGEISVVMGGSGVGNMGRVVIPSISVHKNLDLVLRGVIRDKAERGEMIDEMLKRLEISDKAGKYPTELSGGESLRVAMARAFLFPSDVLLMDEPFRALDIGLKFRLLNALEELLASSPRTVIYVTHDVDECVLAADSWTVLAGSPARVAAEGRVKVPRGERTLDVPDIAATRAEIFALLAAE